MFITQDNTDVVFMANSADSNEDEAPIDVFFSDSGVGIFYSFFHLGSDNRVDTMVQSVEIERCK